MTSPLAPARTADPEAVQIQISEFPSLTDTRPRARVMTWPKLIDYLSHAVHLQRKEDGALWAPAVYRPGATRGNDGVEFITSFPADIDHQALPRERLAGYEYLAVSSYSH